MCTVDDEMYEKTCTTVYNTKMGKEPENYLLEYSRVFSGSMMSNHAGL